jgi:hypothetical protein
VRKLGFLFLVAVNVMWMAACGGSGSSSSTVTSVTVSCSPSTVTPGGTSQCTATVNGTGNFSTSVTWSSSAGTITSAGVLTAPTTTSTVTVTATSTQNTSVSGTATVTVGTTAANVAPLVVDAGPQPSNFITSNVAFVTVTVCNSSTCQTIDHVQVDTGSEGLRLLSSTSGGELTIPLTQETVNGNPLDECTVFVDGYVWGPVSTAATVTVAGETATNFPVQVMIPASSSPGVPSTCSSQSMNGNEGGSVMAFGANGIIGVGPFLGDCGSYCVQDGSSCNGTSSSPCVYYQCPSSGCTPTNVALSQQVPNPVTLFPTDNNGVLIELPTVPDGGLPPPVNGSLIFGIGTESNNGLGSATIYDLPDDTNNAGDFITYFNGTPYPQSFIDSGSNGLFFLDSSVSGVPATCSSGSLAGDDWYCPSTSPDMLTAMNQGQSNSGPVGTPITVDFSIENANTLFNTSNVAFSTLGGPYSGAFDWGLAFFYGRNVFTAIDTLNTPAGPGPYFAY